MEIKNPKNVKSRKTAKLFLAIFGKIFGHKRLKLHRIFSHYDLKFCFYIKIFVRGCLNNNRKMSTNITRRTTRTSQSSPRPIFEARLFKRQSKKRMAGVSSLTILSRISLLSHPDCQCPTHLKLLESCGTDGVTYPNYICRTNCAPPGVHQACLGMCPCKGKTTTGAHT